MKRNYDSMGLGSGITVLLLLIAGGSRAETTVPVTDVHVQAGLSTYNWICTNDSISSSVCGASLSVGFKGTKQVAVLVDTPMAARKDPSRIPVIAWTVNSGPLQTYQFGLEEKSFVLASGVQDPVVDLYIKGMSPSERRWDTDEPVNSLKILGFKVDEGAVTAPVPLPEKIWLNIGDSIMSGDGAGGNDPGTEQLQAKREGRSGLPRRSGKVPVCHLRRAASHGRRTPDDLRDRPAGL